MNVVFFFSFFVRFSPALSGPCLRTKCMYGAQKGQIWPIKAGRFGPYVPIGTIPDTKCVKIYNYINLRKEWKAKCKDCFLTSLHLFLKVISAHLLVSVVIGFLALHVKRGIMKDVLVEATNQTLMNLFVYIYYQCIGPSDTR